MPITFSVIGATGGIQWSSDGGVTNYPVVDAIHTVTMADTRPHTRRSTVDTTLVAENSGGVYIASKTSGTQTFSLPAASAGEGIVFSFVNGGLGTEMRIAPVAGNTIVGVRDANGLNITLAAGQAVKNPVLARQVGDVITLISDGVSRWYARNTAGNSGLGNAFVGV